LKVLYYIQADRQTDAAKLYHAATRVVENVCDNNVTTDNTLVNVSAQLFVAQCRYVCGTLINGTERWAVAVTRQATKAAATTNQLCTALIAQRAIVSQPHRTQLQQQPVACTPASHTMMMMMMLADQMSSSPCLMAVAAAG